MMMKRQDGFTLVELMITMVIFVLAIAAASRIFVGLLAQFKQQSTIAESNIESVVGLELLRYDIEQAGYGLPWNMNGAAYVEAVNDPNTPWDDTAYNDNNNTPNTPRALVIDQAGNGLNGSDILVIKATNVSTNAAAPKWTYIANTGTGAANQNIPKQWGYPQPSPQEDLLNTDFVTVLSPYSGGQQRVLINAGGNYARPGAVNSPSTLTFASVQADMNYQPVLNSLGTTLIYGIASAGAGTTFISMPFNRADYYIRAPAGMPTRCAPGTGVLYKATINHSDGKHSEMPILDCVADMKVVVYGDISVPPAVAPPIRLTGPGGVGMPFNPIFYPDLPTGIRDQVKEVRVYIVAQEGRLDPSYTYTNPNPVAGCMGTSMVCINDIDYTGIAPGGVPPGLLVKAVTVPNVNYRWKLYTLVATAYNLK